MDQGDHFPHRAVVVVFQVVVALVFEHVEIRFPLVAKLSMSCNEALLLLCGPHEAALAAASLTAPKLPKVNRG